MVVDMSDQQWGQGRHADAQTEASRTDSHSTRELAHAGAPSSHEPADGPRSDARQYSPYGSPAYGGPAPGSAYGSWNASPDGPNGGPPPAGYPATGPERPRRQRTMTGILAAAVIAGLVGGGAGFGGAYALLSSSNTPALTSSPSSGVAAAEPGTVAGAAAIAMPSTVDLRVTTAQGTAEGSGVILTADGAVLTNNHVVAGSNGEITVTLSDGTEHTGHGRRAHRPATTSP